MRHAQVKPTWDLVARTIFSDEAITQHFIQDMLDLQIRTITIWDSNKNSFTPEEERFSGYSTVVNVLAELDNGIQVIVSVKVAQQTLSIQNLWADVCMLFADNPAKLHRAGGIINQPFYPVYTIVIVEQQHFDDDRPFRSFSLVNSQTEQKFMMRTAQHAQNAVKLAFMELAKYDRLKITDDDKRKWYEFFNNQEFSLQPDPIIQKAKTLLDMSKWTDQA